MQLIEMYGVPRFASASAPTLKELMAGHLHHEKHFYSELTKNFKRANFCNEEAYLENYMTKVSSEDASKTEELTFLSLPVLRKIRKHTSI